MLLPLGASHPPAVLLPRLRTPFAEFLNGGFPAHLRILSPPACVGLGTGAWPLVRSFSRRSSPPGFGSLLPGRLPVGPRPCAGDLPPARPSAFGALFHPRARAPSRVAPSSGETMQRWNLRQLPIAYALRLGLGPGFPRVDDRCPGSLRLSVGRILAALFATHTGILAPMPSSRPSGRPSSPMGRSPTQEDSSPCRGFGSALEPRVSSAQGLSASELLRTLSRVAASEPTSWLSLRPYILPHLAQHSGPWPAVRAVSLSATGLVTRRLTPALSHRAIRSLAGVGRLHAPLPDQRSTVSMFHARLALKLFRGEPAISALDWHFTPTHSSSQGFSTPTGSALRTLLPVFQPGHA